MQMRLRFLTLIACGLPLMAAAAVPVQDGNGGYANQPPSGYGTAGAEGAYAGGGMTTPVSGQAQLFMQLQQMQDEMSRLRGMLEEQQNQIQQMKQENQERFQDIDSRLSSGAGAGAAGAAVQSNSPAAGVSAGAAAGAGVAAAQQPQSAASSEPGDPAKEKLYYDAAFDLIKAKDFDKASQAFGAFLRKYPSSQYAGNAQYWLGEVNLAKGDLQGAGQAFARVSQAYPSSAKVPDSLYKLADVERRLGNTDKARGILQQVVAQYPGTSAAQLSQRDLKNLK
ncbi:tol-pal system protein YbgF [Pseudomonas nitroreducens]|uniref:tol-pal system protein YbgF n=1 Tax=Pseudomonas TaxID=286 RepID=UPI00036203A5|nr:tol-pal system protein YbgF [Pseudomonas nitroreducens]